MRALKRAQIMADIITFRPLRKAAGSHKASGGTAATIIIFPGVRYERPALAEAGVKWIQPRRLTPYLPMPRPQN